MVCARCGTSFEGRFCPNCGAPAASAPSSPAPAATPPATGAPPTYFRCGRCGTLFSGTFCPACGLPAWSAWIPPPGPRGPSGAFVLLNIAWIASLVLFLIVVAIATAGVFAALPPIASGISDINRGGTMDPGFDAAPSPWTFSPWPVAATGAISATGGNPGPYAEMQLPWQSNAAVSGYWSQSFRAEGSHPYLAAVRLDYKVIQTSNLLGSLTIAVYVERLPGPPSGLPNGVLEAWKTVVAQPSGWTPARTTDPSTGETLDAIYVSAFVPAPGTYYIKIAAIAVNQPGGGPGTPTIVGFDNLSLRWATNAWIDLFVIAPVPILLGFTQDQTVFYAWTAGLVAATVATLAILVLRDRRRLLAAVKLDASQMPAKLRARSAFVAVMQTFLALIFLDIVVGIITQPSEPPFFSEIPPWYLLWLLLNAPVYEEVVFRVLLIGLPLMAGSLALRGANVLKGRVPAGTSKGRYVSGSLRYLVGGSINRDSPRAALVPGLGLLAVSSAIFGLAHAGYGDWKILPTAIAGLGMGYVFLRHGLPAAILFHFANDMFIAAGLLVEGSPAGDAINLVFFLLLFPGAGFFAYYFLYVFRFAQDVARPAGARRGPPRVAPAPTYASYPYATYPVPPGGPYGGAPGPPPGAPAPMPAGYVPATRPPAYGTSPVEYRCPRCAWVEAAYENGHFRCLRCGHVS